MCFLELSCFWEQKKSYTASLKRLVGIKLEGLEIEWTNSALSGYLWLDRAPAGCSPQQNAALGCVKAAQTTAHPLSGFDLSTQDGPSQPSWVLAGSGCVCTWVRDGSREGESGGCSAVSCSLRSLFALQSLWRHQHRMRLHVGSCNWLITVWPVKSNWSWNVTLRPRAVSSLAFRLTGRLRLLFRHSGLLCSPGRTSLVNDRNSSN